MNVKKRVSNPAEFYKNVEELMQDLSLSTAQKEEALKNWKQDNLQVEKSRDEGMAGPPPAALRSVSKALSGLQDVKEEKRPA